MHSTLFVFLPLSFLGAENPSEVIFFHPRFTILEGSDLWYPPSSSFTFVISYADTQISYFVFPYFHVLRILLHTSYFATRESYILLHILTLLSPSYSNTNKSSCHTPWHVAVEGSRSQHVRGAWGAAQIKRLLLLLPFLPFLQLLPLLHILPPFDFCHFCTVGPSLAQHADLAPRYSDNIPSIGKYHIGHKWTDDLTMQQKRNTLCADITRTCDNRNRSVSKQIRKTENSSRIF